MNNHLMCFFSPLCSRLPAAVRCAWSVCSRGLRRPALCAFLQENLSLLRTNQLGTFMSRQRFCFYPKGCFKGLQGLLSKSSLQFQTDVGVNIGYKNNSIFNTIS